LASAALSALFLANFIDSAPVGEFGGDSDDEGRCPKGTNALPARDMPAPCAQVGAKPAADEVAEHVNHVESTPGARVDAVDAGLVGNVTALHAQIHQDDSDNQAIQDVWRVVECAGDQMPWKPEN
jgi:hypothetical protein